MLKNTSVFCNILYIILVCLHLLETSIFITARNTYFITVCNFPVCAINLLQNLHFCYKNVQLSYPDGYILPYANKSPGADNCALSDAIGLGHTWFCTIIVTNHNNW